MKLRIRVHFLSDAHIGTGQTLPGLVDALVARDPDGFPYVPGTSLRGVWRDGTFRAARALDRGEQGAWTELASRLFGSAPPIGGPTDDEGPVQGVIRVGPARLREEVRRTIENERLRDHLTLLRRSTAMDPSTETARAGTLRTIEILAAGATLESRIDLDLGRSELPDDVHLLLSAGAAMVEGMGASRRRGLGHVRVTVGHEDGSVPPLSSERVRRIVEASPSTELAARRGSAGGTRQAARDATVSSRRRRRFTIDLESPVVARAGVAGNLIHSHDHVPGRFLLPVVAAAFERVGADVGAMLSSDGLRVGDATPLLEGGPGLPAPLVLALDRPDERGEVRAANLLTDQDGVIGKPLKGGWMATDGSTGWRYLDAVPMVTVTRNHLDDGGMVRRDGGLHSVQALAAGNRFGFEVEAAGLDDDAWEALTDELAGLAVLGSVRGAEFGAVRIAAAGEAAPKPPEPRNGHVDVWCVTDVVLRDPSTLAETPTILALRDAVAAVLELPAETLHVDRRSVVRDARHDAWHGRWGTHRPSVRAIRKGSVARFVLDRPATAESLGRLQREGLGERRGEGFGRIAVNPEWADAPDFAVNTACLRGDGPTTGASEGAPVEVADDDRDWLDAARRRRIRRFVGEATVAAFTPPAGHGWSGTASRAQIGALRQAAAATAASGPASLHRWLERVRNDQQVGPSRRRGKRSSWPKATVELVADLAGEGAPRALDGVLDLPPDVLAGLHREPELRLEAVRTYLVTATRLAGANEQERAEA